MPKHIVQDVIPPEKRSIRNIPLPEHRRQGEPSAPAPTISVAPVRHTIPVHDHTEEKEQAFERELSAELPPSHTTAKYAIWTTVVLASLFLVFSLLLAYAKATVTVVPKTLPISIETSLVADRSGAPESFPYEVVTVGKTLVASVPATGEQFVAKKASGSIFIYNNYSSAPQRLIKNTRFETKDGLIFRIDSSVTVPGKTTKGGVSTPGSVEAIIVADETGEKYNLGLSDFTIPGFKSDPARFKAFYARSKTPTQGGFLGKMKSIDPAEEAKGRSDLDGRLEAALLKETMAIVPKGYILFPSAFFIATSALPTKSQEDNSAIITQAATATAYILSEERLAEAVARAVLANAYHGEPVKIPGLSDLTIAVTRRPTDANPTLNISVRGQTSLVWRFDETGLKKALAGQSKSKLSAILTDFPAATDKTTAIIRPFFKNSFPADPTRISVEEKLD